MQAIILAAGMGKRLKELSRDAAKCMVEVNGITLIQRTLDQLDELGLSRIVVVAGHKGEKLKAYIGTLGIRTPIVYVDNDIYFKTNNIYSLYLAREYLAAEDTLLLECDIIFEPAALCRLLADPYPNLVLVDRYASWMDGTMVTLDENRNILRFVSKKEFSYAEREQYYKTVNIYKFSREFSCSCYIPFLEAYCKALGNNEYYEQVLKVITLLDDYQIKAALLAGERWYEIDDVQDLDIARSLFAKEDERLGLYERRYGGYWRYPGLLDYCYLVNPFFPPRQMTEEMKASFETLLTEYPSGMEVNSLLAAKCFGLKPDQIVPGNGAAELIKALMERDGSRIGMALPTFEEYPNRKVKQENHGNRVVTFVPGQMGDLRQSGDGQGHPVMHASGEAGGLRSLRYTEQDLMDYYEAHPVDMLVVVNPDNPSGNYIKKEGLLRLAQWAEEKEIRLVVDESFADFAEEPDHTLLEQEILNRYPGLIVVKSISKSYGVPGLRLGILAGGDRELISELKKDVAIWNINSFAEFFLQIYEKYRSDYEQSLDRLRECRRELSEQLSELPYMEVYPSEANYIMCRIKDGGPAATELTRRLLLEEKILIKDLTGKKGLEGGQYIRLAIRRRSENRRLTQALSRILC